MSSMLQELNKPQESVVEKIYAFLENIDVVISGMHISRPVQSIVEKLQVN